MADALGESLNRGILHERSFTFKSNLQHNEALISRWGGISSLPERFKGKHILITGAGPSLEKTISICAQASASPSHVLIASDMSLKTLIAHNVLPRYVITCESTPRGFFSGCDTSALTLLAFSASSPSNLRQWQGGYMFYNWMMKGEYWEDLWRSAGTHLGFVATGGTVVTQAFALVLGCGVASVTFAGNDLAFRRQCYARGTVHDELRSGQTQRMFSADTLEFSLARAASHYRIDRAQQSYHTSAQFLAAKQWIESLCLKTNVPVFDASEPGLSTHYATRIVC